MPDQLKRTCFFATPIGPKGSDIRRRSDQVMEFIINPVLRENGFDEAIRSDRMSERGNITRNIILKIDQCDLFIADLTGRNPNVFYELALRHALGKPSLQIYSGDDGLPFDVAVIRTVMYDLDVQSCDDAKKELSELIMGVVNGDCRQSDNPIADAGIQASLVRSDPDIADVFRLILDKLDAVSSFERQLSRNERSNAASRATILSSIDSLNREFSDKVSQLELNHSMIRAALKKNGLES